MNSLKILIIEDEIITATDLKETLEKYNHKTIAIAKNYAEAISAIDKQIPDLMIIDIRLRNSSFDGIETAQEIIREYHIPFVFLTAHSEAQTFERAKVLNPSAYLLKPFRHRELVFQIELAYNHYIANKKVDNNPIKADNIFLPLEKGHQKIVKDDVLCLKAEGAYVNVYVKNQKSPYLFSMNLGYLAQYFATENFYRLSRSLLINLNHLERLERDQLYLYKQENPIQIPEGSRADLMKKLAIIRTP